MEVTLSPSMVAVIAEKVAAGEFPSAEALIEEAIRSLVDREAGASSSGSRLPKANGHWTTGEVESVQPTSGARRERGSSPAPADDRASPQ